MPTKTEQAKQVANALVPILGTLLADLLKYAEEEQVPRDVMVEALHLYSVDVAEAFDEAWGQYYRETN